MVSPSARSLVLITGESCLLGVAVGASSYLRLGDDVWRVLAEEQGYFKLFLIADVLPDLLIMPVRPF